MTYDEIQAAFDRDAIRGYPFSREAERRLEADFREVEARRELNEGVHPEPVWEPVEEPEEDL